jgi:HEAT repeat protein
MVDATGKKLLRLLRPEHPPEVRAAAALVLGELGTRDAELTEALCGALDDTEQGVRLMALAAVGKLRLEPALPRLLTRIKEGGPESEAAALAAARLGSKGPRALQELMHLVAPGLRRRIAGAVAAAGTAGAETVAIDALLDKDPGVVDAATRSLIAEVPSLTEAHRTALTANLLEVLAAARKAPLLPASETAMLRLLAALADPAAEATFWERTLTPHPPEIRSAALQALGKLQLTLSRDKLKRLLQCAADHDFRVAAPALMIVKAVPVTDKTLSDWLILLDAPDPAVRSLGIAKISERDRPEVAAALLGQIEHPDAGLRKEALTALARLKEGRKALLDGLLAATSPDAAWLLARTLASTAAELTPDLRRRLLNEAGARIEAGDRRADALLFLLREADAHALRDDLEERALALRKKKDYATALHYFRLLTRDPSCGPGVRFEAAGCALKLSSHDLALDARAADPALQQFAALLHSYPEELGKMLDKAKWLEPEELFYLGFHFAERDRREKEFGGEVLHLLVKRSPRAKIAKDAKSKLQREGLD